MLELASENMRETKNKSTVNHGCGSHAILRCGETMIDVQDAGITKDFGNLAHGKRDALSCSNNEASRMLVNQLVSNGTSVLVIGKNPNMKQDINIGKVNNQNFVQVPIMRFADIMKYKCELEGIRVIFNEESYTSKCSFLDDEEICKHDKYMGRRVKRGLFVSKNGIKINADVNGAYNIMKKAIPNAFANGIEGVGVHPSVLTVKR